MASIYTTSNISSNRRKGLTFFFQSHRHSLTKLILSKRKSLNKLIHRSRNNRQNIDNNPSPQLQSESELQCSPILAGRIEDIKSMLKLKRSDFMKFMNIFQKYDVDKIGYYTLDGFLGIISGQGNVNKSHGKNDEKCELSSSQNIFIETVFELSDIHDFNRISYGQLFYTISTFCLFELEEMVKIIFYLFDKDKNGDINKDNMINFCKILHSEYNDGRETLKKNIQTALESFKVKRDGTIGFYPVICWCRRFPSVLEPAFRLQAKIRAKFMGVAFWEKSLKELKKERDCRIDIKERGRAMEELRLRRERKRRIKSELGLQYFFNQRKREHIEKQYPVPVVYLSDDFEIKVRFDNNNDE